MRYPMPRPIRASLAKLYYELLVIPGAEPRLIRGWADTLARLIPNRTGSRRKLEISDLQLSWKSLWRVMEPEIWIKTGNHDSTCALFPTSCFPVLKIYRQFRRTVSTTLLTVAELASRYFPGSEIPAILDSILSKFEVVVCHGWQ
jgi:proteasome activator subunit 4